MPVKHLWNVLNAQSCLFLVQINQQNAVFGSMIIISKHVGQVSSNQPLGGEIYGICQQNRAILYVQGEKERKPRSSKAGGKGSSAIEIIRAVPA